MFGLLLIMNSTRFISPLESHDARRCVKYMQKNPGNVQLSKQGGFSAMAKFTVQPPDRHETTVTDTELWVDRCCSQPCTRTPSHVASRAWGLHGGLWGLN